MTVTAPSDAAAHDAGSGSSIPALDVHAHAMPMPLLQTLADRGSPTCPACRRASSGSTPG